MSRCQARPARRLIRTLVVALLLQLAVGTSPARAASPDPDASPRRARRFAIAVGASWHALSDQQAVVPSLQLEWAPHPHVALELRAATLGIVGDYTAGVKGYLRDRRLTPFVVVRAGVYHYTLEGQDPFFTLHAALGLAWLLRFGLELTVEVGGIFQPLQADLYVGRVAPMVALAVGWRL